MKKKVLNLAIFILLIFTLIGCGESNTLSDYIDNYKSEKTILEDGRVQIKYADGHVEIRPDNTGTFSQLYSINILNASMPPPISDSIEYFWLENHSEQLLDIIKTQVQDDSSIDRYKNFESSNNLSIYQKISQRSKTIDYLVSP